MNIVNDEMDHVTIDDRAGFHVCISWSALIKDPFSTPNSH
jgi:hypothetical protein